jgi:hypothetical protein
MPFKADEGISHKPLTAEEQAGAEAIVEDWSTRLLDIDAYKGWLRSLNVRQLIEELERLKARDNHNDLPMVDALLAEFEFCKKALKHEEHRNKYLQALREL